MGQSRFAILDEADEDEEWDQKLKAVKEKVNSLLGPSRQRNTSPSHGSGGEVPKKGQQGEKLNPPP